MDWKEGQGNLLGHWKWSSDDLSGSCTGVSTFVHLRSEHRTVCKSSLKEKEKRTTKRIDDGGRPAGNWQNDCVSVSSLANRGW